MARLLASSVGFVFLSAVALAADPKPAPLPKFGCTSASRDEIEPYKPEKEELLQATTTSADAITRDVKFSRTRATFYNGKMATLRYLGNWQLPLNAREFFVIHEPACVAVYAIEPGFHEGLRYGTPICRGERKEDAGYVMAAIRNDRNVPNRSLIFLRVNADFSEDINERDYCGSYGYNFP